MAEEDDVERRMREIATRYVKLVAAVLGFAAIIAAVTIQATMQHAYGVSSDLMQQIDRSSPNPNYFPDQYTNQATIREDHIQAFSGIPLNPVRTVGDV